MTWIIWWRGKRKRFGSLEAAKLFAHNVFAKTGIVVAIERQS